MARRQDSTGANWRDSFAPSRLLCLLGALLFAAYPEVLLGTHSLFYRDFGLFTYPVVHHIRESLWRGEIPLWNPLNNCGVPFLAQWNTTVCYPLSLVYVLFPLPWSLNAFVFGHLLLAGGGMYALARCWTNDRFAANVAGLLYGLNGLAFNNLMWTSNLAGMSWLPLVVLAVERAWREGGRWLVWASLAGAMQMLSGAPEFTLVTWAASATLWLGQALRRTLPLRQLMWRGMVILLLTASLSAVQLFPFVELLLHSHRGVDASGGAWSLPASGWVNLFVPLFRCSPSILGVYSQPDQQWTSSYYLSIAGLALAAWVCWRVRHPRVWWLLALMIAGMLLAMGKHCFVNEWLQTVAPVLGWVRYPVKYVILMVFALPLLAAFAIRELRQPSGRDDTPPTRSLVVVAFVVAVIIVAVCLYARAYPGLEENPAVTLRNGVARVGWLAAGVFLLGLLSLERTARLHSWIAWGILFLLASDVLTHAPRQNPTVPIRAYGQLNPKMSSVPKHGESRAMISPRMQALMGNLSTPNPLDYYLGVRHTLYADCNLLDAIPKVNGFYSLYLRREADLRARLYSPTNLPPGLLDFLGVSQISAPEDLFAWEARNTFLPLVTAGQVAVFASETETLDALWKPGFDARATVYLPLAAAGRIQATNAVPVKITPQLIGAQEIIVEVDGALPAMLVIAQSYYPAWHAYVDGEPVQLWPANFAFQALEVPAGRHTLRVVYEDQAFRAGAIVSALALAACTILWLLASRRAKSPAVAQR